MRQVSKRSFRLDASDDMRHDLLKSICDLDLG